MESTQIFIHDSAKDEGRIGLLDELLDRVEGIFDVVYAFGIQTNSDYIIALVSNVDDPIDSEEEEEIPEIEKLLSNEDYTVLFYPNMSYLEDIAANNEDCIEHTFLDVLNGKEDITPLYGDI
ncbi:hypothetical protein D3C81_11310 [compost metagenome]